MDKHRVSGRTSALWQRVESGRSTASKAENDRLRFGAGRGIDAFGMRVGMAAGTAGERIVGFVLREESLETDARTWSTVASLLPVGSKVRLCGYFDGELSEVNIRRLR